MDTRQLRTGTVTFLFSDIEGSTRLLQELDEGYVDLLQRHNRILREAIDEHDGVEVSTEGDSFFVVFSDPMEAVLAAARIQRSLADHSFARPIRVRMGLHTGQGRLAGGDYVGIDVHRAARIAAAGHGGQVLISDATRALVEPRLPPDLTVHDLGPHRLKDLEHPERLYQLVVQGLPSEFPPPKSLDARPNNLPPQLTRFIGRQSDVTDVKRLLLNATRLLTLTGPGGTGKTRLALQVAEESLTAFKDGVWFVDLAPVTDPALVVSRIAETLGVKEEPGRPLHDSLAKSLNGKTMLVVLDNFEQVVDAAPAVEHLLRAAPRVKFLVTSRAVLHRYGEQEFAVPPLDLPDPRRLPDVAALGGYEAIALFVERAAAVKPEFALTSDNASAVAQITVRLDGLPLAIELAASRVKILSPQAILDRLGQLGSPLLSSRVSDAPARQRTLRGAIEWSYELLGEDERRLFTQMSVFQAGADLEAVEAVFSAVPGVDVLEGLAALVDHSLVRQVDAPEAGPRFVMLETIRQYAAERLHDRRELAAATYRAHAAYFADFAQQQSERLAGPDRDPALAAMAADIENLRVAWRYWLAQKDLHQLNRLVDSLWLLYDARGWAHATIELTTDLLSVLSSTPSTREHAVQEVMLRTSLARALLAVHGYTREVEEAYARALALCETNPDVPQLFPVLRGLASFYMARAEIDKEVQVGRDILRLAEAQGDPHMRVHGHLVVGRCMAFQGDLPGGLEHLDSAIASFESHGYSSRRFLVGAHPGVACLTTSALILWWLGHPDRALERANRAVTVATELGQPFTLAFALFHSGFLHLWRREPELVTERGGTVLRIANEHDLPIWTAVAMCLLGAARAEGGDDAEGGVRQMRDGLDLYRNLSTPPVFWPLLLYVAARAHMLAGRPADGAEFIDDAMDIVGAGRSARNPVLPQFFMLKGDLLLASQASGTGPDGWFQRAFDIAEDLGARMLQLRAAVKLCRRSRDRGDPEQGDRVLRSVYGAFTEGFDTPDLIEARDLLEAPGR